MAAARIPVGFIQRAHGVRGDVLVIPLTDNPDRFAAGASLQVEGRPTPLTIGAVRSHNEGLIVSFTEITDRDGAEAIRKSRLMIDAVDRRPLDDDEYWPDDLIGLAALDGSGSPLGRVTDIVLGDAQDRLVVTTPSGTAVEVPFVAAIVERPTDEAVVLHPPEGLFDLD